MFRSNKKYSYGKQNLDLKDYLAVFSTLKSPFLTCGPKVKEFEQSICDYTGAKYCVAVSNATAGLHLAMLALGIKEGDEVITTPITFLSSANCVRFVGGTVKFADIDPETANINPVEIEKQITSKTKGIIPVHFAGQSCDMERIYKIAKDNNLFVVEDAAHAIGSDYKDTKVGSCKYSDMTVFSFHPVKTITTGEGGAVERSVIVARGQSVEVMAKGFEKILRSFRRSWLWPGADAPASSRSPLRSRPG